LTPTLPTPKEGKVESQPTPSRLNIEAAEKKSLENGKMGTKPATSMNIDISQITSNRGGGGSQFRARSSPKASRIPNVLNPLIVPGGGIKNT
jgi:hypothetical protein